MENKEYFIQRQEEEYRDLKVILGIFLDYWLLIFFSAVLFTAGAFVYLGYSTPSYKITAKLLVQDQDKGSSLFGGQSSVMQDFGDIFNTHSSVDNEAEVLLTSDLMRKVVRDLHLYISYQVSNDLKESTIYEDIPFRAELLSSPDSLSSTSLLVTHWNNETAVIKETLFKPKRDTSYTIYFGKSFQSSGGLMMVYKTGVIANPGYKYFISLSTLNRVAMQLNSSLQVDIPNKKVTTIKLQLIHSDPDMGTLILKTIIDDYLRDNIQQKNAFADSTINFINERILVVNNELERIEKSIEDFKKENKISDLKEQSKLVLENSADANKLLKQSEVQEQITKTMLDYLERSTNNNRPIPSLLGNPEPNFLLLQEKYNNLLLQKERLTVGSTNENPLLVNMEEQLENTRKDMITSLRNQILAVHTGVSQLQEEDYKFKNFISSVPEKERAFLAVSREQQVKEALFLYLLQKKEEVAVTKASNIAGARLIDKPQAADMPFSPNKPLILIAALFAGIVVPYIIISLRRTLDYRISSTSEVKEIITSPIIGEISNSHEGGKLVFKENNRSVISEQFRALKTNLQLKIRKKECPVILVTSSRGGEGKSFVVSNLGLAYSSATKKNKKILLMDLDLRKPKLNSYLKMDNKHGYSNFILGNSEIEEFILPSSVSESMDVILTGPIPPNPSEMLEDERFSTMLKKLKEQYDLIIIDSPPIGLVADAQLLTQYADVVLFITRMNYTHKNHLNIINELNESGSIANLYVVVNDVIYKTSQRYGYGHKDNSNSSGYGYGYGYGNYSSQSGKRSFWKSLWLKK